VAGGLTASAPVYSGSDAPPLPLYAGYGAPSGPLDTGSGWALPPAWSGYGWPGSSGRPIFVDAQYIGARYSTANNVPEPAGLATFALALAALAVIKRNTP
jgi:hypothetical protein